MVLVGMILAKKDLARFLHRGSNSYGERGWAEALAVRYLADMGAVFGLARFLAGKAVIFLKIPVISGR